MITSAEQRAMIKPGDTLISTDFSTSDSLAMIAKAKGYKTVIVIDESTSPKRMKELIE